VNAIVPGKLYIVLDASNLLNILLADAETVSLFKSGQYLVFDEEFISIAYHSDPAFMPMLLNLSQNAFFKGNAIMLAVYFYLSNLPFSPTLIALYLKEAEIPENEAYLMAEKVFLVRTEKELDPQFVSDQYSLPTFLAKAPLLSDIFTQLSDKESLSGEIRFIFDSLMVCDIKSQSCSVVDISKLKIALTLISDHHRLLAGLALTIEEISGIVESLWPEALAFLFEKVPVGKRSFTSLSTLLEHEPQFIGFLKSKHNITPRLVFQQKDQRLVSVPYPENATFSSIYNSEKGIPVILELLH